MALFAKSLVAVHLLIDYGCDNNIRTEAGQTTLSLAMDLADLRLVERLLKKGADPNESFSYLNQDSEISPAPGDAQVMPLHLASRLGKIDMMRVLLKYVHLKVWKWKIFC
jgi:ankyrin repeat protein